MIRAFAAGLIVSAAWNMIAGPGLEDPAQLAVAAILLGLVAVILFSVLAIVRTAGYLVVSITAIVAVVLSQIVVLPLLYGAAAAIQFGYPELLLDTIEHLIDPGYWLIDVEIYQLIPRTDLLFVAIIVTAMVLSAGIRTEAADGAPISAESAYAGIARRHDWSEINRLVLAHAYTGGAKFRRSIIDRAREAFSAPAFEAGLDMDRLLRLCVVLERKENLYRFGFVLIALGLLLGLVVLTDSGDPTILVSALVVAALVNGIRRSRHYAAAYRRFGPSRFDSANPSSAAPRNAPGIPHSGQNVLVYRGFSPFDFAGLPLGGWTVAIDVTRAASSLAGSGEVKPFTERELRGLMRDELANSEIEGLSVEELVVAQGADAGVLPPAREYRGVKQPRVVLQPAEIDVLTAEQPDALRRYFWISARSWGGDLTISAFWRCALKNRMLHVELSWFALLPIAQANRALDKVRDHWTSHVGQFLIGVVLFPVALVGGPLLLLGRIPVVLARALGSDKRARSNEIKAEARYNFGAPQSVRTQLMGDEFLHYFQKIDLQYYEKAVDRILLESLVDFLEDHGIDTADLKETQSAIFNSGVIVQGGDVTAQSLAVGEGARAKTSTVDRARRGGAATKKGEAKS